MLYAIQAVLVAYFAGMLIAFGIAGRHFFGWYLNSTPPLGKAGSVVEVWTFWFDRYLTKEGAIHKKKCLFWFGTFIALALVGFIINETVI